MTMAQRINAILAERSIPKSKFYKDCGITSGTFSLWNREKVVPTRKNVEVVAKYLGTTPEYLLTGEGQKEKPTPKDGLTDEQSMVLQLFDALSPSEQRALIATARGLILSRQATDDL